MATTEKKAPRITKANRFEDIKVLLTGEGEVKYGTTTEVAVQFIDNELSLLARKNSKSKDGNTEPTEAQKLMEAHKELIIDFIATKGDDGATCSDMIKGIPEFADFNTSKVSNLTSALVKEGRIVRQKPKKGRTPFTLA